MTADNKYVTFKYPKTLPNLTLMHPTLVMIMFEMAYWCWVRKIDFVVTSTISTVKKDLKLGRVSDSHRTKRAFDLRSRRVFSVKQKNDFIEHFNRKYIDIASINRSDNVARLIVEHGEGDNKHFHIALHSRFSIKF